MFEVPVSPLFSAFGVPATVMVAGTGPVITSVVWVTPMTDEVPAGEFQRREPRRTMALRRDEVPSVPRGTLIDAPPKYGAPVASWKVDGTERWEEDHIRVVVIPAPSEGS